MNRFLKALYLSPRFFFAWGGVVLAFVLAFPWPWFLPLAQSALLAVIVLSVVDAFVLFRQNLRVSASRKTPSVLSLGHTHKVRLFLKNTSNIPLRLEVIDELPVQLQRRNFSIHTHLGAEKEQALPYEFRPLSRGVYEFGALNLYLQSPIGLLMRRQREELHQEVAVYPSIVDMKKYDLTYINQRSGSLGLKKIRRIGHSYEFEQIKDYTQGDDFQSINWKATSRLNRLMVNSYTDERAQQVYCVIDKGRYMKMPFDGLSLVDYSINSSLVIANTSLRKQDRAGLVTFSDKVETVVKAERSKTQLRKILEALYKEKTSEQESNYELLYLTLRRHVNSRSLLFLYTNFESKYALERVLPILRKLNKTHLLVLILFENEELINYYQKKATDVEAIYLQTIARKFAYEKYHILQELHNYGIQFVFTPPQNLSINIINKYLELKSRGMI